MPIAYRRLYLNMLSEIKQKEKEKYDEVNNKTKSKK